MAHSRDARDAGTYRGDTRPSSRGLHASAVQLDFLSVELAKLQTSTRAGVIHHDR